MVGNCVYLKKTFALGAKEHILQAALGARWKNGDYISPEANSRFAEIDADLIETVHPIRVLLGAEGEYGPGSELKNIPDGEGRKYRVASGGDFSLSEPFVKVEQLPDGTAKVHAEINDSKQAHWAAAKIAQHVAQLKPDSTFCQNALAKAIHEQGEVTRSRPSSPLHFQLKLGGLPALRAITKSAFNLLAVSAPHLARLDCFDPVRAFVMEGTGQMDDFIRWGNGESLKEPRIGLVDHFLAVWSDSEGVWGHCQLFGILLHPIRLSSEDVGERFAFSYLVDPLRDAEPAEIRAASFRPSSLPSFNQSAKKPEPSIWAGATSRMEAVLSLMQHRMAMAEVGRIVETVLAPNDGKPITAELMAKVSERVGSYIASLVPREQSSQHE